MTDWESECRAGTIFVGPIKAWTMKLVLQRSPPSHRDLVVTVVTCEDPAHPPPLVHAFFEISPQVFRVRRRHVHRISLFAPRARGERRQTGFWGWSEADCEKRRGDATVSSATHEQSRGGGYIYLSILHLWNRMRSHWNFRKTKLKIEIAVHLGTSQPMPSYMERNSYADTHPPV